MNQRERKAWILNTLASGRFESIHDAMVEVGGDYDSLEAMPFGLRHRPNHIIDDFDAGRISEAESIQALAQAVQEIPDEP